MYPIIQGHDNLSLEDNLKIGKDKQVRFCIFCVYTSMFWLPIKAAPLLDMGPSGRYLFLVFPIWHFAGNDKYGVSNQVAVALVNSILPG